MQSIIRRSLLPLAYFLIALAVYSPALRGELILDDWGYITENPWITTTASPWLFWTRLDQIDYYPLSYTWYWIAWRLFGLNTLSYHLVNVALHAGVATLIASLFRELWQSKSVLLGALAGLIFLLHPQNVPAVAWIVQSKTLLATFLALAATLLYLRERYIWAVVLFALGLGAKASVVSLPAWLFLVAKRERKAIVPILMMAVVAMISAGLASYVNRHAVANVKPLLERVYEVPSNLLFYLRGFLIPTQTAFVHPLRPIDFSVAWTTVAAVLLGGICYWIYRRRARLTGIYYALSFYLLALLPAIGLVPSQYMRVSSVADHYAYFANAGLAILCCHLVFVRWLLPIFLIWCTSLTWSYAGDFATEERIWRQTAIRTPSSAFVWYNLGTVLDKKTNLAEAHASFQKATIEDPDHLLAHFNLAGVAIKLSNYQEAEAELRKVIGLNPRYAPGYANLAHAVFMQGHLVEAIKIARDGVNTADPDADLWIYLCRLEAQNHNFEAAKDACDQALRIAPSNQTARELRTRLDGVN